MAQSTQDPAPFVQEKTFSTYSREQGKNYSAIRRDYHPSLYQTVFDHHASTGGQFDTVIDVGCGPGLATRNLAEKFKHAIGLDPSDGMLDTARSLGGTSVAGEAIRYDLSTAGELGSNLSPPIEDGSVDLITAANAAHWFDMSTFWPAAARVLKPGGTVALWTSGNISAHPDVPNSAAIQAAIDVHMDKYLKPYYNAGNILTRNRYNSLLLPWTLPQKVEAFDEKNYFRKNWEIGETFYTGEVEVHMSMFETILSTSSPRTRWVEANPDLVGTEQDEIRILRREIERLLHEAGVEPGKEMIKGTVEGALLMFKKNT
jgi:SAM-dependent methyltransferase